MLSGGYFIAGREINMPVFFGLLMIYPFAYNLMIYLKYGFFGAMAELLNKKKHIKPLVSVGFHTAIVYSIVFYIIGLLTLLSPIYGLTLTVIFSLYFIYVMFIVISTVYDYSLPQTLIVLFIPMMLFALIALILTLAFPKVLPALISAFLL
jgi:hypothetical protein